MSWGLFVAPGVPMGSIRSQVLPNPGLRRLLSLVESRDAFVEAQIQRHKVGWGHGTAAGGTR